MQNHSNVCTRIMCISSNIHIEKKPKCTFKSSDLVNLKFYVKVLKLLNYFGTEIDV